MQENTFLFQSRPRGDRAPSECVREGGFSLQAPGQCSLDGVVSPGSAFLADGPDRPYRRAGKRKGGDGGSPSVPHPHRIGDSPYDDTPAQKCQRQTPDSGLAEPPRGGYLGLEPPKSTPPPTKEPFTRDTGHHGIQKGNNSVYSGTEVWFVTANGVGVGNRCVYVRCV
ncbi:hypothetical protein LX36DRAFT_397961 [Colletotrichum falcatum]|nr:hypothetical protein LX36DRAFT_397961 [Colletotrichum falcatum]